MVLSNGINLTYNVNDHLDDEILIHARAWGGLSEIDLEDRVQLMAFQSATAVAQEYGAYGLPKDEVLDRLAGRRTFLTYDINYYHRDLYGDCSPQDLETQLQVS